MRRFFFFFYDESQAEDEYGIQLPGLEAAKSEALRAATAMISQRLLAGLLVDLEHYIEVRDERGATVHTLRLGELIDPSTGPICR